MFSSVFLRFRPLFHTFGQKSKKLTSTLKIQTKREKFDENIKKLTKRKKRTKT